MLRTKASAFLLVNNPSKHNTHCLYASLNLSIYHLCRICPRSGHHSIRNKYSETRWARLTIDVILNEQRETRTAFSRIYIATTEIWFRIHDLFACWIVYFYYNLAIFCVLRSIDPNEACSLSIGSCTQRERGPRVVIYEASVGRIMIKEPN